VVDEDAPLKGQLPDKPQFQAQLKVTLSFLFAFFLACKHLIALCDLNSVKVQLFYGIAGCKIGKNRK
jgi:hypothetical protein